MNPLSYINNTFRQYNDVHLHISDLSIHRAYGIFDYMAQYGENIPFINSYLDRFFNSALLMHLQVPHSKEEIKNIILQLVSENKFPSSGIKLLLTGGYSDDGYTPGIPNFVILNTPLPVADPEQYSKGVSLITCHYKRSMPVAKTIDYSISLTYHQKMKSAGAVDVLYVWENDILEASRCNFFILKNNVIITAKENVLLGITRSEVIKLASKEHIIEERPIEFEELITCDGCFITSTTKGIMPVAKIDDIKINNGQIHPVIKFLIGEFNH
ncbi:MAG: aminotransferase class IV [Chitinophagales bacterium]